MYNMYMQAARAIIISICVCVNTSEITEAKAIKSSDNMLHYCTQLSFV